MAHLGEFSVLTPLPYLTGVPSPSLPLRHCLESPLLYPHLALTPIHLSYSLTVKTQFSFTPQLSLCLSFYYLHNPIFNSLDNLQKSV